MAHHQKIIKTNLKTLVSSLLTRPQGSQGCQKMRQDPLNMPVEVWCAKIAPKLKNIWKSLRKQGFFWHFFFNFDGFWSLCLLRAILAQKENSFIFRFVFYIKTGQLKKRQLLSLAILQPFWLIFCQKSCCLGPTIFKIPQPNWY